LRTAERRLLVDGKPVELGARAFDVLVALVENRNRVVSKDELLAFAWPGVVVEENNLQQQISTLRKLLGQRSIVTVPGRGYQFTLEETAAPASADGRPPPVAAPRKEEQQALGAESSRKRTVGIALACAVAVLVGAGIWWNLSRQPSSRPTPALISIAVLPFANLTGDPNQDYVADGFTAALTNELVRIRDAYVVDASRAQAFKEKPVLPQEAGDKLGVRFVLVGSVGRSLGRIRFHAQLDDTASGAQLWSDIFEGDESDLFALEDRVTARIVNSIDRAMFISAARDSETRKNDPKVADLLLRAWALKMTSESEEKWRKQEELYRQALAIDPDNAVAMVGLASAMDMVTETFGFDLPPAAREQRFEEERALALKAKSIDPGIPGIYVALSGYAKTHDDFAGYRQAMEARQLLEPRNPVSYYNLAESYLDSAEPQRAIELFNRGTDLDPKNPRYWVVAGTAYAYFMLDDNDAAIQWSRKAQEINSILPYTYAIQAMAYARKGDTAKSRAAAAELRRLAPKYTVAQMNRPTSSYPEASKEYWNRKLVPAWRLAGLPE
jgi:TolB-like protein/DNA-binding winged helix-turn-helix (wHTH) protein/tetratricopeptide (TPR) repeat protein